MLTTNAKLFVETGHVFNITLKWTFGLTLFLAEINICNMSPPKSNVNDSFIDNLDSVPSEEQWRGTWFGHGHPLDNWMITET